MRKSYLLWIVVPVAAYLGVVLLVALLVVTPSPVGWAGFAVASAIALLIAALAATLYPRTRTNAVRIHPRSSGPFRLLVVADALHDPAGLCRALGDAIGDRSADVLVVAPVLVSPLHYLTGAEEQERDDARVRLSGVLAALAGLGIEARGLVGTDDPLQAIGDALADFPANEILLLASDLGRRTWLEKGLERQVRDLYGVHVSIVPPTVEPVVVERDPSALS